MTAEKKVIGKKYVQHLTYNLQKVIIGVLKMRVTVGRSVVV